MTAYIEQALPAAESSQVVQHLAECGYCREIVSLSLPEPQPVQIAAQAPVRSRWWVPAYRWAAVAATLTIAATLVIEKPWKTSSNSFAKPAAVSDNAQTTASNYAPARPSTTTQPANPETATGPAATPTEEAKTTTPSAPTASSGIAAGAKEPEFRDDRTARANESSGVSGAARGMIGGLRQAPAAAPQPPPPPVVAARGESTAAMQNAYTYNKDSERDYLNRSILSNQTVEVSAAGPALPEAPSPKEAATGQDAAQRRKNAPKLSTQNLVASAMDVPVTPPNTAAEQPSPPPDSTLAKSSGFMPKLKSTLGPAVRTVISTAKKAGAGKQSESVGGFSLARPGANLKIADADQGTGRTVSEQIHWSITPDGRLLQSTDVGQWHAAYPQGPDLQFRVVEPRGSEVWAGGNHGTLIHSWNAGVDWSKLNVPDSATSDITGISIDGDNVQVKTSNGQTFVSTDHGKTWDPLQQQPPN
ncbi:MAG TPA: YCF48-related protein [Candidatus Angelobacter sp.]